LENARTKAGSSQGKRKAEGDLGKKPQSGTKVAKKSPITRIKREREGEEETQKSVFTVIVINQVPLNSSVLL
jgi:hypothetical protein